MNKGVGRKISRGATKKRPKNSKKDGKLALLYLFQERGGRWKKKTEK